VHTIGVVVKHGRAEALELGRDLAAWLHRRGMATLAESDVATDLASTAAAEIDDIVARADLIVVLGGDGTLLATARLLEDRSVPILAVNLGSLGFLTEITLDEMYGALEAVLADRHRIETRRQLAGEVERQGQVVARYWALNDIVLHKASLARILDFDVSIDAHFVSRIRADGLIVSTPTGSTAYSLSAGGPIVLPSVEAMVVTPIAPHMLTNRPLVIPGNSVVEVVAASPGEHAYVTADGQEGEELDTGSRVRLRVSDRKVQLVTSPNRDYFQVLRSKLHWGER
jgi:NAD+ kinase